MRLKSLTKIGVKQILKASIKKNIEYPLSKKVIKPITEVKRLSQKQVYGSPIDFRGLRHAPLNEMGAIYLFAIIARDLGFRVEAIGTKFPDCEAIRRIGKTNKWERIHIEFEYKSSNYKTHGHPIEGCDLIVCWEHDWKECPIEVLELKDRIEDLGA